MNDDGWQGAGLLLALLPLAVLTVYAVVYHVGLYCWDKRQR